MSGSTLRRTAAVSFVVLLSVSAVDARQSAAPDLSRQQRAALQAVVRAIDGGAPVSASPDADWPLHVLRASDGSHYVAFSVMAPPGLRVGQTVTLYVRLATRRDQQAVAVTERSGVAEWLAGVRGVPLPPKGGIAFGEMPTYGAGASEKRGVGPQGLRLLEMERDRARERREADERERKARLEGGETARVSNPLLPFEDFDVRAVVAADSAGRPVLRRSFTAGPGAYDLTIGWVDPAAKNIAAAVHVVKRPIQLEAASTTAFALSTVIVADEVSILDVPFDAAEQSAHPYSIGRTAILPARDHALTNDERLALVVQVINPRAAPDGKPDVAVGFRVFRLTPAGEDSVGTLASQLYNASTLPADFDASRGHPLFVAVGVPLRTFKRGNYRLRIVAEDRLGLANASAEADFSVVGTPAALLRDAPPLGARYRRDAVLAEPALGALLKLLRPPMPSAAMQTALEAAQARRFAALVRDDAVAPAELGARTLLRALGLYALGDTAASLAGPLRLASQQGAPIAAVNALSGALRALEGNDADAVAAWQTAIAGGIDAAAFTPLLVDAALRQSDWTRASDLAQQVSETSDPRLIRQLAAARIAAGREAEAVAMLEKHLTQQSGDTEAQWLLLHALFSGFVKGQAPGADSAGRARFAEIVALYLAADGAHAALAREWRDAIF